MRKAHPIMMTYKNYSSDRGAKAQGKKIDVETKQKVNAHLNSTLLFAINGSKFQFSTFCKKCIKGSNR